MSFEPPPHFAPPSAPTRAPETGASDSGSKRPPHGGSAAGSATLSEPPAADPAPAAALLAGPVRIRAGLVHEHHTHVCSRRAQGRRHRLRPRSLPVVLLTVSDRARVDSETADGRRVELRRAGLIVHHASAASSAITAMATSHEEKPAMPCPAPGSPPMPSRGMGVSDAFMLAWFPLPDRRTRRSMSLGTIFLKPSQSLQRAPSPGAPVTQVHPRFGRRAGGAARPMASMTRAAWATISAHSTPVTATAAPMTGPGRADSSSESAPTRRTAATVRIQNQSWARRRAVTGSMSHPHAEMFLGRQDQHQDRQGEVGEQEQGAEGQCDLPAPRVPGGAAVDEGH